MLFSHDGIHDSQTHLSTAPFFYEQLRREIALSNRSGKAISLIRIRFHNTDSDRVNASDILHFSSELTQLARSEDCIGRLQVNEVVIIVRDGATHGQLFVERLLKSQSLTVNQSLHIHIAMVTSHANEGSLAILERLDREVTRSN